MNVLPETEPPFGEWLIALADLLLTRYFLSLPTLKFVAFTETLSDGSSSDLQRLEDSSVNKGARH